MKKSVIAAILLLAFATPVFAITEIEPDKAQKQSVEAADYGVKAGDVLYMSDCVRLAVKNSPKIRKAEEDLKMAYSDINLAKSDYFPTFGLSARFFQEFNSLSEYDSGTSHTYLPTVGVYLNQLIWDFGKTSSIINMQKFNKLAAEYNYIESVCDTINEIKLNYFAVLKAKAIVDAEKDNYDINKRILDDAKAKLTNNTKVRIDYINAEVYFSNAKMRLEKAENDYNQSMVNLCNSMYVSGIPDFTVKKIDVFDSYDAFFTPDFLTTPKGQWHKTTNRPYETGLGRVQPLHFTMEKAIEAAYANSPDIKAINATIGAMNQSVKVVKRQYLPVLSASAGYNFNNRFRQDKEDYWQRNNNYGIAVNLSTQINGMKFKNEVAKSKSHVVKAEQNLKQYKEDLYFAVKRCYMNVETAEKQILNAQDQTQKAIETLKMTSEDYEKNQATYLELQSARQNYNNARISYANVIYDYNSSLAKLQKAMHYNIDEIYYFAEKANPKKYKKIDRSILDK